MFNHEKFEAYHLAIEYWERALRLLNQTPAGHAVIKDQLKRAAASIPLNIAEGSGRTRTEDRKRFYAIARGSAFEWLPSPISYSESILNWARRSKARKTLCMRLPASCQPSF